MTMVEVKEPEQPAAKEAMVVDGALVLGGTPGGASLGGGSACIAVATMVEAAPGIVDVNRAFLASIQSGPP